MQPDPPPTPPHSGAGGGQEAGQIGDDKSEARHRPPATTTTIADVGAKALTAVAAGIGVLGFVTLTGGAIMHAQMSAAGLPSDLAVSTMPQSTLLVIGARLLVPLFAVLLLCLSSMWLLEKQTKRTLRQVRTVGVGLLLGAGLVVAEVDTLRAGGNVLFYALPLLVSLLLGAMIWFFGIHRNPEFWLFAIVTSAAAALFVSAGGYAISYLAPSVRPAALVRTNGDRLVGIYAAANTTDVAIGEVCQQGPGANSGSGPSGTLVVIPRADVKEMLLGTNGSLSDAMAREPDLLRSLPGKQTPAGTAGPVAGQNGTRCTGLVAAQLQAQRHRGVPGIVQGP